MNVVNADESEAIKQSIPRDALMDEKSFLQRIGIRRAYLHRLKKKGMISYLKVGRRCLYDEQSYRDFLNNCTRRISVANVSKVITAISPHRRTKRGSRRHISHGGQK